MQAAALPGTEWRYLIMREEEIHRRRFCAAGNEYCRPTASWRLKGPFSKVEVHLQSLIIASI